MLELWVWQVLRRPNELQALSDHPSDALRIAAVGALRRELAPTALVAFLRDASVQVRADAVRAIYDEATPEIFSKHPELLDALADLLDPEQPAPINVRAIAANRRLGTYDGAKRIAAFLKASELDSALKLEGLLRSAVMAGFVVVGHRGRSTLSRP